MSDRYTGHRVGSAERNVLQVLLGAEEIELPPQGPGPSFRHIFATARQRSSFPLVIESLAKKRLVALRRQGGAVRISLTDEGARAVQGTLLGRSSPAGKPEAWDGNWHVVSFDVPEVKRRSKGLIRHHLKRMGFVRIEPNVWVRPFPCDEILELMREYYGIESEAVYSKVKSLENEKKLRKIFSLK